MKPTLRKWLTGRQLYLFHPDGTPPTRSDRIVAAIYNATRLVIEVPCWPDFFLRPVPRRYREAYRRFDIDATVYAVPPIHWMLRAWGSRWAVFGLARRLGFIDFTDLGSTWDGHGWRFRWPWVSKWTMEVAVMHAKFENQQAERTRGQDDGYRQGYQAGVQAGEENLRAIIMPLIEDIRADLRDVREAGRG